MSSKFFKLLLKMSFSTYIANSEHFRMLYNKKYEVEDKDCILRKAVFKLLEEERNINE